MSPEPNAILRGGSQDGFIVHVGRDARMATFRPATGEEYRVTDQWEGDLRVYRLARPDPEQGR